MRVAAVQWDVQNEVEKNIETVRRLLTKQSAELFVLPELCDCGYLFPSRAALQAQCVPLKKNKMVQFLLEYSRMHACAFAAGVAEPDGANIYDTAVIISDGQLLGKYRKIHLSDFEKAFFDAGCDNQIFQIKVVRCGVQICFDLWFPEVAREQVKSGAELLIVLSAFGNENTRNIAAVRALENATPLLLCNRVGTQIGQITASFLGRSAGFSEQGDCLFGDIPHKEACVCGTLTPCPKKQNALCADLLAEMAKHP